MLSMKKSNQLTVSLRKRQLQEEYERLKPYDMVFMYFASNSNEKGWKNVIKEYNVTGANVAHYNLPDAQQKLLEKYVGVQGYPTYRLIDHGMVKCMILLIF